MSDNELQLPSVPNLPNNESGSNLKESCIEQEKPEITIIKTRPPKQIPQRENHLRLSYIYQLSTLSALRNQPEILSRVYNKNFVRIQKKSVLKISPHIKRTICKKCDRLLVDGINGELQLKGEDKNEVLELKCTCGKIKRFPVGKDPNYQLFIDRSSIDL